MSEKKEAKPRLDPASSQALTKTLIGNENQHLQAGSWSIRGARIVSGNVFAVFNFGEQLIKHGVPIQDTLETMKAATIGLSPKIPAHGERGEILDIMTQTNREKEKLIEQKPTEENQ